MKPILAVLRNMGFDSQEEPTYYLKFDLTYENEEGSQEKRSLWISFADKNFDISQEAFFVDADDIEDPIAGNPRWLQALFYAWKSNLSPKKGDTYSFIYLKDFSLDICKLVKPQLVETKQLNQKAEDPEEDILTSIMSGFNSCLSYFFPAAKPLYVFTGKSNLEPEEVVAIVARIHELQREKESFFSMRHERKDQKIKGLIDLLEESKKTDFNRKTAIDTAMKIPGMLDGNYYTRTNDLFLGLVKYTGEIEFEKQGIG